MWPTIDLEKTGENIEKLCEESGYSVKKLHEKMPPMSIQAIYKWMKGASVPSVDNLLVLSEIFGVPIDRILVRKMPAAA